MLITLLIIVGLAVLILAHEFGHFIVAKWCGMRVDEFAIGFPPRLWSFRRGETKYSINLLPFGGYVKIAGENDGVMDRGTYAEHLPPAERKRFFSNQPAWRRSLVILAGVFINIVLGWLLISAVFMLGSGPGFGIGHVLPDSPAAAAGIKPGDVIQGYGTVEQFIAMVHERAGEEIGFEVRRGEEMLSIRLTPRVNPGPNEGPIGIVFAGIPRLGFFDSLIQGFFMMKEMALLTLLGFWTLLAGIFTQGAVPSDIVGPVGIFGIAHEAGRMGLVYLLQLLAFISINLGVLNLIPFPALDGGRFIFILIEKIKGSPIPRQIEMWVNITGFALLILLMIIVTVRDVVRL